ncbi:MAG: NAD-dependent epimerase/dehydratase family protein [Ferruginibacter sp.]|nr:NAD-dependent epimerase/dehydratase family protein [Ferruginibacter sp.]
MQTILGGNGTIGSVLAKELTKYTNSIRLVSRHPKKVNATDELFPTDLSDPEQVEKAIAGSEVVYLLVGFEYTLKVWQDKWPKLMRASIDACIKHHAKLVFFDNVYLYDIGAIPHMTEDSYINPPSKKGMVRRQIADMLMTAVKSGKLTGLIARSADFYGPSNDKSFLIEVVYKNIKKGKKPNWFIKADKKHSFTYTPDAAKATAILGNTADAYGQVWHLPTDKNSLTGKEMISLFTKEMNVADKVFVLPMWLLKLLGLFIPLMKEMPEMMYQYDRDYVFDSSKFQEYFNFSPTSYQQGVKETIAQTMV